MPNVRSVAYGRPLLEAIAGAVAEAKTSDPLAAVTVLVPHNTAGLHLRRQLAGHRTGLLNVRFTTLRTLARLLADDALAGKPMLTQVAATLATRRALRDTLSPLARLCDHPATVARATRTLSELRRVKPGWQANLPDSHGYLADLFAHWRSLLEPHFADEEDVFEVALAALETRRDLISSWGTFIVCLPGWPDFRQQALGEALAERAQAVLQMEHVPPAQARCALLADAAEEARFAVAEAGRAAEQGIKLDRIAIVSATPDDYAFWVQSYAEGAGIPVHGTSTRRLGDGPAGRALRGLLQLDPRLERHEMLNWWACAPMEYEREPISVPDWDRITRSAGVTRGAASWESLQNLSGDAPRISRAAQHLSEYLQGAPESTWGAWVRWALGALGLWLDERQLEPSDAEEYSLIGDRLRDLDLLDALEPRADRTAFRQAVDELLREAVPPKTRYGTGLFFGRLEGLRGLDFDRIFILGMHEGGLPRKQSDDPVFPSEARPEELRQSHLSSLREAYDLARSASPDITFVASRIDRNRQRERLPSIWWLEEARNLHRGPVFSTVLANLRDENWLVYPESVTASLASGRVCDLRDRDLFDMLSGADPLQHPLVEVEGFEPAVGLFAARRTSELTEFDGMAGPPPTTDEPVRLSSTVLEDLAVCPHRYWLKHVLRVAETEEPEEIEAVAADVKGQVIHEALRKYGEALIEGQFIDEADMGQIADEALAVAEAQGATGYPVLWRHLRERLKEALMEFVEADRQFRKDHGSQLDRVEHSFDGAKVGPFVVRGRIDRIDRTENGWLVIDYKTGSLPGSLDKDPLNKGRLVQLGLYAEALRHLVEPFFIRLQLVPKERWKVVHVQMSEPWRQRFRENLATLDELRREGIFPPRPGIGDDAEHCRFCPYDRLCVSDRKAVWGRKRTDPRLEKYLKTETNLDGSAPVVLEADE